MFDEKNPPKELQEAQIADLRARIAQLEAQSPENTIGIDSMRNELRSLESQLNPIPEQDRREQLGERIEARRSRTLEDDTDITTMEDERNSSR